ncbi:MAG TPA: hypothetical protein VMH80_11005 [Bryobacteraceae bacterium]|nr:hypothetical protein [Bryobacteraceae bacterium]
MRYLVTLTAAMFVTASAYAQRPPRAPAGPPPPAKAAAPIDLTGYWVSLIVDEWRFRVTPQKGDIAYMPINAEARRIAEAWDPDKDTADGNQCRAYGAVGVMQRPGRLHITWEDDNTMRIDADSGTQTRVLHFGRPPAQRGEPSWQGYSTAQWLVRGRALLDLGGIGFVFGGGPAQPAKGQGSLKVVTTNMLPGYIRKNGVPYSGTAVLTEYMNLLAGAEGDVYLAVTAMVEDPVYLNQPFVRTYTFKKQPDASGWDPTSCWPK